MWSCCNKLLASNFGGKGGLQLTCKKDQELAAERIVPNANPWATMILYQWTVKNQTGGFPLSKSPEGKSVLKFLHTPVPPFFKN